MNSVDKRPNELGPWLAAIGKLMDQIDAWAGVRGWWVAREEKSITEPNIGTYRVPVLRIKTASGQLVVEPVALNVVGATGRVDIYSWPSLSRVMLVDFDTGWKVVTTEGVATEQPWSESAFMNASATLVAA